MVLWEVEEIEKDFENAECVQSDQRKYCIYKTKL